ncbi:MAG: NAD-dependent epimerase/dehydratase family protein [Planctomycetota bacterium]
MKALVTGGGGFLGTRIAQLLHARGDEVMALGRNRYPHLEAVGIETVQSDLRDAEAIDVACEGMDVVFHVGAVAGIWGTSEMFWDINAGGTANVLAACRSHGVPRLVYTSSPSVVFGRESLCGVDESQPYPRKHLADYPKTKAVAERMVIKANKADLSTVALRPHFIFGPGDPHLVPRVIDRARRGKLKRVGDGSNLVDLTYIDNAADAHVLAADSLAPDAPCAGKAYFITQGEPVELWSWINELLSSIGVPAVRKSVSYGMADTAGRALEWIYRAGKLAGEPPMTRFMASQMAKSHYFCIDAARRDFGYEPRVSNREGLERLVGWLTGKAVGGNPITLKEPAKAQSA